MNYFKSGLSLVFAGFMAMGHGMVNAESVANVRFASGLVTAKVVSLPERQLAKGDDIESGSRIDTAANGRVQMRFTDGGLVSLMPDSTFSVEDYAYQDGADDGTLVFGLLRGGLRTMTGAIGKKRHEGYQLNTPVATLGIRGTQFTVVLNPPNTMRVHVGEGKVVITNSSGTLEVPAGRNAVVTLGSAPEFTEQGPMYLATAPGGDKLVAANEVKQDPLIGPPLVDLDILRTIEDFELAQATPPIVIPPFSSTPLPDGAGYVITGIDYSIAAGPSTWSRLGSTAGLTGAFDGTSGGLLSLDTSSGTGDVVQQGTFQLENVVTRGALSWGEFTDGSGTWNSSSSVNLAQGHYAPYVVGLHTTNTNLSGTLNYTLDGATPVRYGNGASMADGKLEKFDLGLNLGGSTYTLDMRLSTSDYGTYTAAVSNSDNASFNGGVNGFNFHAGDGVGSVLNSGSGCDSAGCRLDVEGFLAGPNAEQAGVGYVLTDRFASESFIGAAGLK